MSEFDYDVLVVGSGFGGSVAALRLTEKGYRVGVMEAGRRFADDELPKTSWRVRRYMWAPWARCFGIMRITLLKDVLIASGAGVGGGSLVYANTLYEPLDDFYDDPQWADIADWKSELAPHYAQAKKMLGVTTYQGHTPADEVMQAIAGDYGVGDTFHPADVGVLFGSEPGADVDDPFFGGAGPARKSCINCGACMTGCRHNAKNTLVKNYLYLAEQAGAEVHPMTRVVDVRPEGDGYRVRTHRSGNVLRRRTFTAGQVVFAGNALNTQRLLHKLRLRVSAQPLGHDRRAEPYELRGGAVSAVGRQGRRLHAGHRDHLVVPPRPPDPHRAGAVRPWLRPAQPDEHGVAGSSRPGRPVPCGASRLPPARACEERCDCTILAAGLSSR